MEEDVVSVETDVVDVEVEVDVDVVSLEIVDVSSVDKDDAGLVDVVVFVLVFLSP